MRFHKFDEKPKNEFIGVKFSEARELNLKMYSNKEQDVVWVKKSAYDLAKESIRRKEETRMVRAKND